MLKYRFGKSTERKILLEIWRTNALKINKIKSRWIPAAESNGILFAPNEGYGLLTLAHILDQVLLVNLPEFSHLEGRDFAAVQKTKQQISANMRNFHDLPEAQDIGIVV